MLLDGIHEKSSFSIKSRGKVYDARALSGPKKVSSVYHSCYLPFQIMLFNYTSSQLVSLMKLLLLEFNKFDFIILNIGDERSFRMKGAYIFKLNFKPGV